MIIEKPYDKKSLEQRTNKKDLVAKIFKQAVGIYRTDENLKARNQTEEIDSELEQLKRKVNQRTKKLEESVEIERELNEKIDELSEFIISEKTRMLKELGSEI